MQLKMLKTAFLGLILSINSMANAGIIEHSDINVNGSLFNTYYDQTTNLTWLDIDSWQNFGVASYETISDYLSGTNFHIATLDDVNTLLSSIPLSGQTSQWEYYEETMGAYSNWGRDLIWAVYQNPNGQTLLSKHSFIGNTSWSSWSGNTDSNSQNIGTDRDLGWFVVSNKTLSTEVPEPSSLAIFALSILGLASRRFKKQ